MSHQQTETKSVATSTFHSGWIRAAEDRPWEVVAHNETTTDKSSSDDILPCTYLDLATNIHMPALDRMQRYGAVFRWNKEVNFHEKLRVPASTNGMIVVLEAMASEALTVAVSPEPSYEKAATYEITFGAVGNTKTTISRRISNSSVTEVSIPCRVCQDGSWCSYWIGVMEGNIYAGVGNLPGEKCLLILEGGKGKASDNKNTDEPMEKEEEDKLNREEKSNQETPTKSIRSTDSLVFVALGNASQHRRSIKVRNLCVTPAPSFVADKLKNTSDSSTMDVLMEQQDQIDDAALKEFQEQCRKAKARAQKFGVEYKEPNIADVIPWSQARRLRANPQQGFITGIDVTDAEEKAKQEARKARFGAVNNKKRSVEEAENGDEEKQDEKTENDGAGVATTTASNSDGIPVIQAWDNEELVRFQRSDPPQSLWDQTPDEPVEEQTNDEFAMETDKPTLVPEKVHVFSIDWSAFKQIRSEDLMAYFNIYGPSYVEWLGDLSCNILFEDKFSAVRALQNMGRDLPNPPPHELSQDDEDYVPPNLSSMGWKLGRKMVRKIKDDRFGRRGTTARVLMRPATSLDILVERPNTWPEPPPGFSTKRILGPGSDYKPSPIDQDDDEGQDRSNRSGSRKRRRRNSDGSNRHKNNRRNSDGNNSSAKNNKRNRKRASSAPANRPERGNRNAPGASTADLLNQGLSARR